jgi:hypothetical protein
MKLMTKELEKSLPFFDTVSGQDDPMVLVHYFNPIGAGHWFGIEYDKGTKIFFGYVSIFGDHNDELGDFSLYELAELELPFGMHIERDLYWTAKPLSEVKAKYTHGC